jgi:hypothetical protein
MRHAILRSAGVLSFVSSVVVSSCSSSSSAPVTADDACNTGAAALCGKVKSCAPLLLTLIFGDEATCTAAYKQACLATLAAPKTGATPAAIKQCGTDAMSSACSELLSHNPPTSCRPTGGMIANGMACGDDWQCTSGRCSVPANATCGVCGDRAAAGGTCTGDEDCAYALACTAGVCVARGAPGAPCDLTHPCAFGSACIAADGGTSGTCGTPAAAGEPCTGGECDTASAAFCNPLTRRCQVAMSAMAGGACGIVNGNLVFCEGAAGACTTPTGAVMGTCPALVEPGGACAMGMPCKAGSKCVNSVCKISDPSSCQ